MSHAAVKQASHANSRHFNEAVISGRNIASHAATTQGSHAADGITAGRTMKRRWSALNTILHKVAERINPQANEDQAIDDFIGQGLKEGWIQDHADGYVTHDLTTEKMFEQFMTTRPASPSRKQHSPRRTSILYHQIWLDTGDDRWCN